MMKENSRNILKYLQDANKANVTADDIEAATGIPKKSITGCVNALVKKELAIREPAQIKLDDGTMKDVKFIKITDAGLAFDPDAEEAK